MSDILKFSKFRTNLGTALLILMLGLSLPAISQTFVPAGKVSGVWTAVNSPYIIQGYISVEEDQTLIIKPGVVVKFENSNVRVDEGEGLIAEGTPDSMIVFTSNKPNPAPGDWGDAYGGIVLWDTGDKAVLKYCIVEYATHGITCRASAYGCDGGWNYATIENCIIRHNRDSGIFGRGAGSSTYYCIPAKTGRVRPKITSNLIYENGGDGIELSAYRGYKAYGYVGGEVRRNVITGNSRNGISCSGDDPVQPQLINNTITNNRESGIRFRSNFDQKYFLIANNIVAKNGAGINSVDGALPTYGYNDVWDNGTNYQGLAAAAGDISNDPLFVNAANRDYHLQSSSPCIDAGNPTSAKDPDSTRVDMGAFYFHQILPPKAEFVAAPVTGLVPLTVQFTNQSTGEITSHRWNFGDGQTSLTKNPSHTFETAGKYTIKLTVTGPAGSDSVARTDYITVINPPPPVARFTANPTSGPAPLTVRFTNQSTGSMTSRLWNFGDGQTSTEVNPTHVYSQVGNYTASLTVAGLGGSNTATTTISACQTATVNFAASTRSGVVPLTVQFTNQSSGSISSYYWTFGDGQISTQANPSHTYQSPGVYSVMLQVNGPCGGNSKMYENYITVNPVGFHFTDSGINLTPMENGSARWGDYDNDGDLDILMTGRQNSTFYAKIYRNSGSGLFASISTSLAPVAYGNTSWGDYDNDGDLDILLSGWDNSRDLLHVYRNDGNNRFTKLSQNFKVVGYIKSAWLDHDSDGDLDIIVTGYENNTTPVAYLYVNNRSDSFTLLSLSLSTQLYDGSITTGDYDNDGDMDLLLTGRTTSRAYTILYRNEGNARFTNVNASFQGVYSHSAAQFGDYDNDGDLDILLSGNDLTEQRHAKIYRNNGYSNFTDINAGLAGQRQGGVAWGDYDNDGDLDVIVSGQGEGDYVRLYRNLGNSRFAMMNDVFANAVGPCEWGDYDKDGDLDLLLAGSDFVVSYAKVYRNDLTVRCNKPSPPANLRSSFINGVLTMSWDAATDHETPAKGLYYNLRVGTSAGGMETMAAHANSDGTLTTPAFGNVQQNKTWVVRGLDPNLTYYWAVQTIDGCLAGSEWATADASTGVTENHPDTPLQYCLEQNYPNPFNPTTTIEFTLADPAHVSLSIYDMTGQLIRVLQDTKYGAGVYQTEWDGRDTRGQKVASGVYLYNLRAGKFEETRKMILAQ